MNHPMQGTAADIMKLAMIAVDRALREADMRTRIGAAGARRARLRGAADEVDELSALVKREMQRVAELCVPLVVDVSWGENWARAK